MPRNGSGVAVGAASSWNPAVASTTIDPGAGGWETAYADLLAMLTQSMSADGQTPQAGNLNFGGSFKITNAANGTAATDYATLSQVQGAGGSFVSAGGVTGTADAILLAPSPAISAYAAGQEFWFVAEGDNTTAVTVATSGLAVRAVQANGAALVAGDIKNGRLTGIKDNGTNYQLIASRAAVSHTADYADGSTTLAKLDTTGAAGVLLQANGVGVAPSWGPVYATGTFTPAVAFGGAAVGVTYSVQTGNYYKFSNFVFFAIRVQLTSKGSSTGSVTITGLPFTASQAGTASIYATFFASLTGTIVAQVTASATTIGVFQTSATGTSALADTNVNNASSFTISGLYLV